MRYIDQDTRDEIQRAHDSGTAHEVIAGQIGTSAEELCRLMGWPQWKPVPPNQSTDEFCLFEGSEALDGQL